MFVRIFPYCDRRNWAVALGIVLCMLALSAGAQEKSDGAPEDRIPKEGLSEGSTPGSPTSQGVGVKRIVILYTHRQMSPINKQWHSGIVEGIKQVYNGPIDIETEYMDVVLQDDKEYFNRTTSDHSLKYSLSSCNTTSMYSVSISIGPS